MNRTACSIVALAIVFSLSLAAGGSDVSVAAPEAGQWAPAQRLPGVAAQAQRPYLVADQNRGVHAFSSEPLDDVSAIVYRKWTLAEGWTTPVDVLLSPEGGAPQVSGAYLDRAGTIHLVYFGNSGTRLGLYYSTAAAAVAGRAGSWSPPVLLAENAAYPNAAFSGDDRGNLLVLYSAGSQAAGVYAISSANWGVSWSKPRIVYMEPSVDHMASDIQVQLDAQLLPHAVWTVNDARRGMGTAIYYARLEEDRATWSEATQLASLAVGEDPLVFLYAPSLIEHNNELIFTYISGHPPTRWMRRSGDGGRSWSAAVQLFGGWRDSSGAAIDGWRGNDGATILLHDSSNVLHMVFGNRVQNEPNPIPGIWHSVWSGSGWGQPEAAVAGREVAQETGQLFAPVNPAAAMSQGNVLLVTWVTDPGAGRNGIWYSYSVLNAPEAPVAPLPAPSPVPTATHEEPAASVATRPIEARGPLSALQRQDIPREEPVDRGTTNPWVISILPPLVLTLGAIGAKAILFRRR